LESHKVMCRGYQIRFRAPDGGSRHQSRADQEGKRDASDGEPERLGGLADAALKMVSDDDGDRREGSGSRRRIGPACGHLMIVSPGHVAVQEPPRPGHAR
jgi:hypothetical protein